MKTLNWRLFDRHPFRIISAYGGVLFPTGNLDRLQRVLPYVVIIIINLALTFSTAAQDSRGIFVSSERLALVIGNNAYQTAPLRNPVNDAEDMSRVLSALGFKVILKKNVDRRTMEDSIRSFGRQLRDGGIGLFYFAGHGMQIEGRNYLIPVNARIESESDIKYEAVDAGLVLGKMEDANNQLNIVILDACRNNPFLRNFRTAEQGLARMDAPKGALVAYSTAPGEVSADGFERNGIFTKHLIRHMQTPNLPVEQVLKRVRIDVATETTQRQIPWESSSLMGDFYFKIEKAPESAEGITPIPSPPPPKESLSSTPKSETITPTVSSTKRSLAIFPIHFSGPGNFYGYMYDETKKATIDSLKKLMKYNEEFFPVYSYYELAKGLEYSKINPTILNEKVGADLWVKEGFFSNKSKPNIPLVVKLGNKLGVDAILMIDCGGESIGLYIFEVKQEKVSFKEGLFNAQSAYTEVPKQMKEFLANYKHYMLK